MVRDALIKGLSDSDIQQDVLGHNDQDMTLEDTIKFIEAKEAGKRSQATLQNPSAATLSSYKQTDKDQHLIKCRNCGKTGHGDGRDAQERKEKCKAWDKTCSKCDKKNHFSKTNHPKRLVRTKRRMRINPALSTTKCATFLQPAPFPLEKRDDGWSSLTTTSSTTKKAGSPDGRRHNRRSTLLPGPTQQTTRSLVITFTYGHARLHWP